MNAFFQRRFPWVFRTGVRGFGLGLIVLLSWTTWAEETKGRRLLQEKGLQLQGLVTPDDGFNLNTYSNAAYTSLLWIWDVPTNHLGSAPGFPWGRWVGSETNPLPAAKETAYLPSLFSLQLGDEWNLNDPATRTRAVQWFEAIRTNWPQTLLYMNNYGSQVTDAALTDFVARARPDLLSFDTYPWRSDYRSRHAIGGTPFGWYGDLRRYREHARVADIPLACYMQTFHAVQDYDQTVFRDPSGSELHLNHWAALAFNAKALIDFTYNTGASTLFTHGGGSSTTEQWVEKAELNRRIRHWSPALVRLQPVAEASENHTTSLLFLRGRNAGGAANPLPIGFLPDPSAPNDYSDWTFGQNDPYLVGWKVTNRGNKNNSQPGDVLLSWFRPWPQKTTATTNATTDLYLMVVNGLSHPTGSAADCRQEINLNFRTSLSQVILLDPATGRLQTNTLPLVNARHQLTLLLDGGDAALLKFPDGRPFLGIEPARER